MSSEIEEEYSENLNNTVIIEFKKHKHCFFMVLGVCSALMTILISTTIVPTMKGAVIIMVIISYFVLIFCFLFSLYMLVLNIDYSYLFIQGDNNFYIKFITGRKYIYDYGDKCICYKINKAQKSYKANNLSEFKNSGDRSNTLFKLEKYKTINGYQERWNISSESIVSKWCKKGNLDFNDKVLKNLTINLLSSPFEARFEYLEAGIYKVEPQIGKFRIEHNLGDFEIKYNKQCNVLKIISLHYSTANSDAGYGGKSITKYTIKQFHNLNDFNYIKYKEKSIYSIIQMICKDTGMQMPK
ncbi:MAG: hypothetical protein FWF56_03365 [Firmicutes bacterium]|nr:hypothetical protein [Bacillota bacterium]MCL1953703.1 hypothetical protein [Bacillota bacterium]